MIFGKPEYVVLLKKNSLIISHGDEANTTTISFPPTSVNFLEVIDPSAVLSALKKTLETFSRHKGRAVILLGNDMVFSTILQSTDPAGEKKETFFFFNNIPLIAKNVAGKTLRAPEVKRLFATNQEIITLMNQGFQEVGWKIDAIAPASLFLEPGETESLSKKDVRSVRLNRRLLHLTNFLLTPLLLNQPESLFVLRPSWLQSMMAYAPLAAISVGVALLAGAVVYGLLNSGSF